MTTEKRDPIGREIAKMNRKVEQQQKREEKRTLHNIVDNVLEEIVQKAEGGAISFSMDAWTKQVMEIVAANRLTVTETKVHKEIYKQMAKRGWLNDIKIETKENDHE